MSRAIPLVDLQKFTSGTPGEKQTFVDDLGHAFQEFGFVGVIHHGIPKELVERFYAKSKAFFSLPAEIKREYEDKGLAGQRGYTSFGQEHAKQSNVGDLKEFYQLGQEPSTDSADSAEIADYPPNMPVKEIPAFVKTGLELFKAFEASGAGLLQAIALYLQLPEHYFDDKIEKGNSILRAIHYPPITQEPKSAIRAEQHEDINLITLLVGASAGGLQILDLNNQWLDIVPGEDEIVVNVGDMLQRLTNNYLKSTTHRVVNPPREEWHRPRLSIPFFLHPKGDMDLTCLDTTVTRDRPSAYTTITAGDYLNERLREIGLKK